MMETPDGVNRDFANLLAQVAALEQSVKRIEDMWNADRERQEQDHRDLSASLNNLREDVTSLRSDVCGIKNVTGGIPTRWVFGVAAAVMLLLASDNISSDLISAIISGLAG